MRTPYRRRSARGGVLVLGGGLAGSYVARQARWATVVSQGGRLTRAMAPEAHLIIGRAVDLDPDRRVVEVETDAGSVVVAYVDLVIALGSAAMSRLGLPVDGRGKVRVDEMLQVVGWPHVWALGGGVAVPNAPGDADSPTATGAIRQAGRLMRNLRGVRTTFGDADEATQRRTSPEAGDASPGPRGEDRCCSIGTP